MGEIGISSNKAGLPHVDECTIALISHEERYKGWDWFRPDSAPNATPEQYRAHFDAREKLKAFQDGRLICWCLVKKGTTGPALSYVETWRSDGFSKQIGGDVIKEDIYGVFFVVTPPENRRRGYSHRLLRMLHYMIAGPNVLPPIPVQWGPLFTLPSSINMPPGRMSCLNSIAPVGFYEKALIGPDENHRIGWAEKRNSQNSFTSLELSNIKDDTPTFASLGYKAIEIGYHDLPSLGTELSKVEHARLADSKAEPGTTVYRFDLASPGELELQESHKMIGVEGSPVYSTCGWAFGVRLVLNSDPERNYRADDPIFIFNPYILNPNDICVYFTHGWTKETTRPLLRFLRDIGKKMDPPCARIMAMALEEDDPLVKAVFDAGGKLGYRCDEGTRLWPTGVAWYGVPEETARLDGRWAL